MKLKKTFALFGCCTLAICISNFANAANPMQNITPDQQIMTKMQNGLQEPKLSGHVEKGVRVIEVQAFKYGFNPDPIVVKAGEKVKFLFTTKDVAHGFGVTELGINVKIPPNKTTTFEFVPKEAGNYRIHCTIYCGFGHSNMQGALIVLK